MKYFAKNKTEWPDFLKKIKKKLAFLFYMCYDVDCCDMIAKIREVAGEAVQSFLYKETMRRRDIYCVMFRYRLSRVFPGSECLEVIGLKISNHGLRPTIMTTSHCTET